MEQFKKKQPKQLLYRVTFYIQDMITLQYSKHIITRMASRIATKGKCCTL